MAESDSQVPYYIRVRGRVLGPYSVAQLKTLRGRGQFSRANEVSNDGETWLSAATIDHLLGSGVKSLAPARTDSEVVAESNELSSLPSGKPPSRSMPPIWYYAIGTEQYGPTTLLELRGLIVSGQLSSSDLVWKEGLPEWTPFAEIPELSVIVKSNGSATSQQAVSVTVTPQNFCFACGSPTDARAEICPKCGVKQLQHSDTSEKSRITAALLAFFLGGFGIHHFYLEQPIRGVIYLVFFWTFIPAIIAFVEFIIFLCMSDKSFAAKYNRRK